MRKRAFDASHGLFRVLYVTATGDERPYFVSLCLPWEMQHPTFWLVLGSLVFRGNFPKSLSCVS